MGDAKLEDAAAAEAIDLELIRRFLVVAEELNEPMPRWAGRKGTEPDPAAAAYWTGGYPAAGRPPGHTEQPAALA